MREFPLIDLSRPHLITLAAARYYGAVYQRVLERKLAGMDIRVPVSAGQEGITPRVIEFETGTRLSDDYEWTVREGGVAVIPLRGPIVRYASWLNSLSGIADLDTFARSFQQAQEHTSVRSILTIWDTPGGDATSIAETAERIYRWRGNKPMVGFIDGSCCSGGQWLIAAHDECVISPTGLAGSIGAVIAFDDDSKQKEMMGITERVYKSSRAPKKWAKPGTEEGDNEIQQIVDTLGELFGEAMAKYRGVSLDTVWEHFGQGGVLMGAAAARVGLVDRVGDFESLVAQMADGYVPLRRITI